MYTIFRWGSTIGFIKDMKISIDVSAKKIATAIIAFAIIIIQWIGAVSYWIILVTLPFYLLFVWNFKYANILVEFFKYSLWPLVALTFIFLFRDNLGKLIDEIKELNIWGAKTYREPPQQDVNNKTSQEIGDDYKKLYGEYKQQADKLTKTNDELQKELVNTKIELDFERIYTSIFGSQLNLLELLIKLNKINLAVLDLYYSTVQKKNLALSDWSLSDYLRFMINSGLIQSADDGFEITLKGRVFFSYVKDLRHYILNKSN